MCSRNSASLVASTLWQVAQDGKPSSSHATVSRILRGEAGISITRLSKHFLDHRAAFDDFDRACAGHVLAMDIDTQGVINGRKQILDFYVSLRDFMAVLVGAAEHKAALDSGAGQGDRKRLGIVIAPHARVNRRRAAELAHPYD